MVALFYKVMKRTVSPLSTYVTKIVKGGKILNVWVVPLSKFFKYNFFYSFLIYFIFLCNLICFIRLILGDGSNAAPFCVSMTSKKLLSTVETVSMWQLPVVLHMDGTFKLNKNEFPVITLGISDFVLLLRMHRSVMSLAVESIYSP